jgi:hypothetical protein
MKRTPLKRISAKRRKLMATAGPERRAYKEQVGQCMICRRQESPDWLDAHEIAAGAAREACLTEWNLILVVCRECHERIQHSKPEKQIAYLAKWFIDQACAKYNELKGTAPTHVTAMGVLDYLDYSKDLK